MTSSPWLRIIQVNDVYELGCFPNLQTLIREKCGTTDDTLPDRTLVVLCGDFLAPSLLSSLDHGSGMVDCLNAMGFTHVCFGNHEADVPELALRERIQQSQFPWINTNMQDLNRALGVDTPEHCIIELSKGTVHKKVVLLGLLTDDPSLYRPRCFAGAHIEPILQTTEHQVERWKNVPDTLLIPLTHQGIEEDRKFAEHFGGTVFPIILGGHDHEPFDETIAGCRIIKTGMDAQKAGIIDIKWSDGSECPTVTATMLETADYAPDETMQRRVMGHERILRELQLANLFRISDWVPKGEQFSTKDNRLGPSIGTSALATMLRMGMRCHACLVNAGSVRANRDYPQSQDFFTWSDLKAEIPFTTDMVTCNVPGHVLESTIAHSRKGARLFPPVARGGYLHTCYNIKFNNDTEKIESVGGKPFDPDLLYFTALPSQFFDGIDNHEPLLDWAKASCVKVDPESAIPAKMIIVQVFSATLWLQLGSFPEIDRNHDGVLRKDEVKQRLVQVYGEDIADLVLENIFSVADLNDDGTITPLEMMVVQFVATDILDHVCTKDELQVMKEIAASVLGKDPSHDEVKEMVERIRDKLDIVKDGRINRNEMMQALGELYRKEMLE